MRTGPARVNRRSDEAAAARDTGWRKRLLAPTVRCEAVDPRRVLRPSLHDRSWRCVGQIFKTLVKFNLPASRGFYLVGSAPVFCTLLLQSLGERMKSTFLLSAALLLGATVARAEEPLLAVENEVSFTVEFVTFKEAKAKFRPVHQAQPVYPAELLHKGVEGVAVVAFLVNLDGKTSECQVAAATNPAFGEAARAAIEQWQFTRPQFGGKPGPIAMQFPIEFKVADDAKVASGADVRGQQVALRSRDGSPSQPEQPAQVGS